LSVATVLVLLSAVAFAQFDSENVSLIGRLPYGQCDAAFGDSNYAYIGNGSVLEVLDISIPGSPVKVGEFITESRIYDIHVSDNYACIANWSDGFKIIDVSDPAAPTEAASMNFEGQCWKVSVFDSFAYVGNDTLGLRIIDISDPTSPVLVGTFNPGGTVKIECAQIIDSLAYVATYQSGMYILDISDPSSPDMIGYCPTTHLYGSYDICVANDIAYLPEFQYGLCIIDVSDPYSPTEIGYFDTPGSASSIEIVGDYAYVADGESGLYIIDVSNPISPDSVAILDTEYAIAFNIHDSSLYLADRNGGFKIIDIDNPTSPTLTGFYKTGGYQQDVYVSNNRAYVAEGDRGLSIIDITNPYSPTEISNFDTEYASKVHGSGDYVYVNDDGDLLIIDVSDPYAPTQVGFWPGGVRAIYAFGNHVYLGGSPDLRILDVSDPGSPNLVSTLDGLSGSPRGIYVAPGYVYLANRWGGLRIIDISNPSYPTEVGYYGQIEDAQSVYVNDNYAYVSDIYVGLLKVIDISDPYTPHEVATVSAQPFLRDVDGSGDFVYALGDWAGVYVFDVSGPTNPMEVGYFNTGGYARGIYAEGPAIFVADGGCGFYILLNEAPTRSFVSIEANLPPLAYSSVDWGDYDSDGDLDILLTGLVETPFSIVYRNDGNNAFTLKANLIPLSGGSGEWGDYDNDGDLDVLLTGKSGNTAHSLIYRNDGEESFININAQLIPVGIGSAAWGDYDNDGDLDALLTGFDGTMDHSLVYRNDGNDIFTNIETNFTPVGSGDVDWGDYDNDGDLDILLTGRDASRAYTIIYRNDNNGDFLETQQNLQPMWDNTAEWVDYDNDGDLDIFLTGRGDLANAKYTKIYRNDANDIFTDTYVSLPPTSEGAGCWGDYDNDGDFDLLLMGWNNTYRDQTKLYRNDKDGLFTEITNDLIDIVVSAAQWGDHDNDGDLDLIMTGYDREYVLYSKIYRNDGTVFNTGPDVPTNLSSSFENGTLTLSWAPATDDETPLPGLSYNLRVGTTPEGDEIMSSHSDNCTGYRRLSGMGNVQKDTSWTIYDLDPRGTYYWAVQTVDAAYAGSNWASSNVTSIYDHEVEIPDHFSLSQNYPNPFNSSTTIHFSLPHMNFVTLKVYNILGEEVATLVSKNMEKGRYNIEWDASDLPSGVYYYQLQVGYPGQGSLNGSKQQEQHFTKTKKLILLK